MFAASKSAGVSGSVNYIEDVFSTWLYNGGTTTQTITNGIDLSTKGGMVWIKSRGGTYNHSIWDSARSNNYLVTNDTGAQTNASYVNFLSSGFTVTANDGFGYQSPYGGPYASWTFRKQPKFFDIVTFTGDGTDGRAISHSLGSVPGCIIMRKASAIDDWYVYHRSGNNGTNTGLGVLNSTAAFDLTSNTFGGPTNVPVFPTSTTFTIRNSINASGATYIAYIFAHNAGGFGLTGTDNVISCGSFTTDGSGYADVNLGYEPQWILIKASSAAGAGENWITVDNMRGVLGTGTDYNAARLNPNNTNAEGTYNTLQISSTGFKAWMSPSVTYIYIAIRRGPMKVPTSGTSVFQPVAYTGTNVDNRLVDTSIVTDMTMARIRTATSTGGFYTADRLRGNSSLGTAITDAENADADSFMTPTVGYGNSFSAMNGFGVGNDVTRQLNQSSTTQLAYAFKRAPSFMDVVCYTGTGSARTVTHNLGVAPELMIVKSRNGAAEDWRVYYGVNQAMALNTTGAGGTASPVLWNDTAPTSSVFSVGTSTNTNGSGYTYVAYLFATLSGVSKVGSYTGNGSTQTIDCGLTAGARFVLLKRTDAAGDWYVYDTARGMTTLTDPYWLTNTTAAEVTTLGSVTTVATGFALNSTILAAINVNAATYIFLAIA